MFNTLKKLRSKNKDKKNKRKEKKHQDKQADSQDKRPSLPGFAFHLGVDETHAHPAIPGLETARRHSCFPAFQHEKGRRPSLNSRRSSVASTCSAEGLRVKRLIEIAQLDKYIEHLKKSVDDNNISYIPNRLCCVQLLKSVLQRRERQYVYEYLHSNRSSSESDISIKSRESETKMKHGHSVTFSDEHDNTRTNDSRDAVDNMKYIRCHDDCHGTLAERLDNNNGTASDFQESEEEERVPGALLKAYDSDGTRHSAGSDSDSDDTGRYKKKRSSSKSRRRSIALFPQNFEIF